MTETTFQPLAGASVWEQSMLEYLHDHSIREGALLEEYAHVAEHTESKALQYAMRMLLDDEERHHQWFRDLAAALQTQASMSGDDPAIPWLDLHKLDHATLEDLLKRMVDNEKRDARELKRLRHELDEFEDTTLWALLVDLMQRDTDKHVEILGFLRKHMTLRL